MALFFGLGGDFAPIKPVFTTHFADYFANEQTLSAVEADGLPGLSELGIRILSPHY